jgi:hypothetical protein
VVFSGMSSLLAMRQPALSRSNRACAPGEVARGFVEVELHHVGVGIRRRQGRSDAPRRHIAPNG